MFFFLGFYVFQRIWIMGNSFSLSSLFSQCFFLPPSSVFVFLEVCSYTLKFISSFFLWALVGRVSLFMAPQSASFSKRFWPVKSMKLNTRPFSYFWTFLVQNSRENGLISTKMLKMIFQNALPILFFLSVFYFLILLLVYFQKNGNNIKTHGCYSVLSSILSYLLSNFYSCCFFFFFYKNLGSRAWLALKFEDMLLYFIVFFCFGVKYFWASLSYAANRLGKGRKEHSWTVGHLSLSLSSFLFFYFIVLKNDQFLSCDFDIYIWCILKLHGLWIILSPTSFWFVFCQIKNFLTSDCSGAPYSCSSQCI